MGGKTSAAAKNRYNNKTYDHITIIVPKGEKAIIKSEAEKFGMSVTQYIRAAISEKMKKGPDAETSEP